MRQKILWSVLMIALAAPAALAGRVPEGHRVIVERFVSVQEPTRVGSRITVRKAIEELDLGEISKVFPDSDDDSVVQVWADKEEGSGHRSTQLRIRFDSPARAEAYIQFLESDSDRIAQVIQLDDVNLRSISERDVSLQSTIAGHLIPFTDRSLSSAL